MHTTRAARASYNGDVRTCTRLPHAMHIRTHNQYIVCMLQNNASVNFAGATFNRTTARDREIQTLESRVRLCVCLPDSTCHHTAGTAFICTRAHKDLRRRARLFRGCFTGHIAEGVSPNKNAILNTMQLAHYTNILGENVGEEM